MAVGRRPKRSNQPTAEVVGDTGHGKGGEDVDGHLCVREAALAGGEERPPGGGSVERDGAEEVDEPDHDQARAVPGVPGGQEGHRRDALAVDPRALCS